MISNTVHELTGYLKAFFQLAVLILGYNINLSPEKKFANMFYCSVGLKKHYLLCSGSRAVSHVGYLCCLLLYLKSIVQPKTKQFTLEFCAEFQL